MLKRFLGLVLVAGLLFGCYNSNLNYTNPEDSESLNNSSEIINGVRGTVKIPGMKDASNCLVIVERQIDGIRTASVYETTNRGISDYDLLFNSIFSVYTDKNGIFEVTGMPEGTYTVTVKKENTLGAVVKDVVVKNDRAIVDLDIVLTATGRITGRVTLSYTTSDMYGSFVYAEGTSYIAATDGTGDFCIKSIPIGTYNIVFYHEGYNTYIMNNFTVTAAVDNSVGNIELQIIDRTVSNITDLNIVNGNGAVTLLWSEPEDLDFEKVEITYSPGGSPIYVEKGTTNKNISGLTNGTNYTFTVKSVDTLGNISAGLNISSIPDGNAPIAVFLPDSASTPSKNCSTTVIISDINDISSDYPKYQWTNSDVFPTGGTWTTFTNGQKITKTGGDGNVYLHVKTADITGNTSNASSGAFVLDNASPIAPVVSGIEDGTYREIKTFSITGETGASLEYSLNNGTSWSVYNGAVVLYYDGVFNIIARQTDVAGNISPNTAAINIGIDMGLPEVIDVSSDTSDGHFKEGEVITVVVKFSEAVIVTETPRIALETGVLFRYANYVTGSGTDKLVFAYTVQSGDTVSDLDYKSFNSLELYNGLIKDTNGNRTNYVLLPEPGEKGSLSYNKNFVLDTTPPVVNAGADIGWRNTAANLDVTATDVNGMVLKWEKIAGTGTVNFGNDASCDTTVAGIDGEEQIFTLRLTATDFAGNSVSDTLVFNWDKKGPVVNAGADITWRNTTASLDGTVSESGCGITSYLWEKTAGTGTVNFGNDASCDTTVAGIDGEEQSFALRLTSTDALGNTGSDTLVFNWDKKTPVVNAGGDISVTDATANLDGTVSDGGSGISTYLWEKIAGTGTVNFGNSALCDTTVDGINGEEESFTLRLTATDITGNSSSDTMIFNWDKMGPTAGGSGILSFSNLTSTSLTVNWIAATDAFTAQSDLQYLLYQSTSDNISTWVDCEANGTAIGSYQPNIVSGDVSGLTIGTIYYFNVVVKDGLGYKSNYTSIKSFDLMVKDHLGENLFQDATFDFGRVDSAGYLDLAFTIHNLGATSVTLTGTPRVQISGTDASCWTMTVTPIGTITGQSYVTFNLKLTPGGVGVKSATITIPNNDIDENPYTFVVTGTGVEKVANPTFNLAGGDINAYTTAQSVEITSTTAGAIIRYTTDLSTPSRTNGTEYTGAFNLSQTSTIRAIAYIDDTYLDSDVVEIYYYFPPAFAMIDVPAGMYMMQDTALVELSAFKMGNTEITYKLWKEVYDWAVLNGYSMNAGLKGSSGSGSVYLPVISVCWYDVVKWCNAYTEYYNTTNDPDLTICYYTDGTKTTVYRTGDIDLTNNGVDWSANGYRLPTEAEWEYAARYQDGTNWTPLDYLSGAIANYSNATASQEVAWWYNENSGGVTHAVGIKRGNQLNLFDMSGNVREWNWDWYGETLSGGMDPAGPEAGSSRHLRGGDWWDNAYGCQVGNRNGNAPYSVLGIGFRLVRRAP